jgi:hypothetical protein
LDPGNYILVLVFGNIAGEDLWWRGFCYRAKNPLVGPMAWLLHGPFWAAFHLYFQTTNRDLDTQPCVLVQCTLANSVPYV